MNGNKDNHGESILQFQQSAFYLISNILIIQIIFTSLYLILRFPKIYLYNFQFSLDFLQGLQWFGIFYYLTLTIIQISIIVYLIIQHEHEYFELKPLLLAKNHGIANRKKETYSLRNIETVTVEQNLLGKWFNFGDIKLYNSYSKSYLIVRAIPNPYFYASKIEEVIGKITQGRMIR
jgi:hypothetical protein